MPGKQAKFLSAADLNDLLVFASCTRNALRNRVIVLLSAKAGLRAGEIANLTWDMVLDATGRIGGVLELRDSAAKKGSGRIIPLHPHLCASLVAWRRRARNTWRHRSAHAGLMGKLVQRCGKPTAGRVPHCSQPRPRRCDDLRDKPMQRRGVREDLCLEFEILPLRHHGDAEVSAMACRAGAAFPATRYLRSRKPKDCARHQEWLVEP